VKNLPVIQPISEIKAHGHDAQAAAGMHMIRLLMPLITPGFGVALAANSRALSPTLGITLLKGMPALIGIFIRASAHMMANPQEAPVAG
jgi:hypothetical protein